jgi:hypothetical protein
MALSLCLGLEDTSQIERDKHIRYKSLNKQLQLVVCMLKFTYELMLSEQSRLPVVAFQPFLGKAIGLRKNK